MIFPLILALPLLCQILSTSFAEPVEPRSAGNSKLQELEVEAVTPTIFTDYVLTKAGILKIHTSQASWNDARNICLDENAQLAVIDSAAKEAIILKHMKEHNVNEIWVGVHDLFGRRQWTTVTGERLYTRHYVHWRNGEPNGAQERCVEMHLAGLNDMPCDTERNFICEKEMIL